MRYLRIEKSTSSIYSMCNANIFALLRPWWKVSSGDELQVRVQSMSQHQLHPAGKGGSFTGWPGRPLVASLQVDAHCLHPANRWTINTTLLSGAAFPP
jgi:hypothetical protein